MASARIGLALGSGSARGWSHIGVIEGLAEAGIHPDIVCGCSIGAVVGAAYVAGALAALKDFAQSLTLREIARFLDIRLSGGGLIGGQEIVALLRKLKISGPISSFTKPFAAVATDLHTGREIWLREGPIDDAVRASISLPGILSPATNGDRWLVDGGLVNPVPVSVCRALGADVVIAVNLNGDLVDAPRPGLLPARCGQRGQRTAGVRDTRCQSVSHRVAGAGVVDPPEAGIIRADISRLFPGANDLDQRHARSDHACSHGRRAAARDAHAKIETYWVARVQSGARDHCRGTRVRRSGVAVPAKIHLSTLSMRT